MDEIIVYTVIAAAVGYAGYALYKRLKRKDKCSSGCDGCMEKNHCSLYEIKQNSDSK